VGAGRQSALEYTLDSYAGCLLEFAVLTKFELFMFAQVALLERCRPSSRTLRAEPSPTSSTHQVRS